MSEKSKVSESPKAFTLRGGVGKGKVWCQEAQVWGEEGEVRQRRWLASMHCLRKFFDTRFWVGLLVRGGCGLMGIQLVAANV
jgi:hypothetical protein